MKIYPKKLRGVAELQQEKKRLLKQSRRLKKEKSDMQDREGVLAFLPVSNPLLELAIKIIQKRISKKPGPKAEVYEIEAKPRKNRLKSVAIEFVGGYLKWKAIEWSYKGIRHLVKKHKEKIAAENRRF
jgi:hypothetical protein